MKPRHRTLLGRTASFFDRERIYLCEDAIEKDLIAGYDIEIRRLFFIDMEMISWHRQFSTVGLWFGALGIAGGILLMLFLAAILNGSATSANHAQGMWIAFWICLAPNIPIMLWFMRPYAYVTLYGKRNRATMSWHFRHGESRRVFEDVAQLVRSFQEQARLQLPPATCVPAALAPPGMEGTTPTPPLPSLGSAEPLPPAAPAVAEVPPQLADQPAPPPPPLLG